MVEDRQLIAQRTRPARSLILTLRTGRSRSAQRWFAAPLLRAPHGSRLETRHCPTRSRAGGRLGRCGPACGSCYFSQTLVVGYEQEHGKIPGHYRDPRGHLHEPHTGRTVALGTREVAAYVLPSYVFDKILYVEKEGFRPIFDAARLAERYDMAIAYGKGQPVEAIRALFERAQAGDYRLFVLHDADTDGYSIARTIAEETERMPDYSVEVVDLGLSVGDAIGRGVEREKVTRFKELPWWMPERLDDQERAWFEGRLLTPQWAKRRQWECSRVELNALTASDLIAYIDAGLQRHGASTKIVPPPEVLDGHARLAHQAVMLDWVERRIAELFETERLARTLADEFAEQVITDPAA
jgi:hypothetical protein